LFAASTIVILLFGSVIGISQPVIYSEGISRITGAWTGKKVERVGLWSVAQG